MAMPMNQGSGPQWANPNPVSTQSTVMLQEEEFFAPLCKFFLLRGDLQIPNEETYRITGNL